MRFICFPSRILDIDKWDNGSLQYDLVSCLNLLDRADKPVSILHSIKRVLKPGGRVLIALVLPFSSYVEFGGFELKPGPVFTKTFLDISLIIKNMNCALYKGGLMQVSKVSSQISLCSLHRLIRDDTLRLNCILIS